MPPSGITAEGQPDQMKPEFEVLPAATRTRLREYLTGGGALLISGAHIAEDLASGPLANEDSRAFGSVTLGLNSYNARATRVNAVANAAAIPEGITLPGSFRFGHDLQAPINIEPTVYPVLSAESLEAAPDSGLAPILVYGDSRETAALIDGTRAILGFPIETILPPAEREKLYGAIVTYLMER